MLRNIVEEILKENLGDEKAAAIMRSIDIRKDVTLRPILCIAEYTELTREAEALADKLGIEIIPVPYY